jgi:hypothetical protein
LNYLPNSESSGPHEQHLPEAYRCARHGSQSIVAAEVALERAGCGYYQTILEIPHRFMLEKRTLSLSKDTLRQAQGTGSCGISFIVWKRQPVQQGTIQ